MGKDWLMEGREEVYSEDAFCCKSLKLEILDMSKGDCLFSSSFYCCLNTACFHHHFSVTAPDLLCLLALLRLISPTGTGKKKIFL